MNLLLVSRRPAEPSPDVRTEIECPLRHTVIDVESCYGCGWRVNDKAACMAGSPANAVVDPWKMLDSMI